MIYFLQQKGDHRAPIKIGFTKRGLYARIEAAQFGYPFGKLVAIGVTHGTEHHEQQVHGHWRHLRMHGEWFASSPELLVYIAECSRPCWTPEIGVTLPYLHAGHGLTPCLLPDCICRAARSSTSTDSHMALLRDALSVASPHN